jgi:hypothetical protein
MTWHGKLLTLRIVNRFQVLGVHCTVRSTKFNPPLDLDSHLTFVFESPLLMTGNCSHDLLIVPPSGTGTVMTCKVISGTLSSLIGPSFL